MRRTLSAILPLTIVLAGCTADPTNPAKPGASASPSAGASPTTAASPAAAASAAPAAGGVSAAAQAAPFAVGRTFVYDTRLNGVPTECTITIKEATEGTFGLEVTNRYGRTVDTKSQSVSRSPTVNGHPFGSTIANADGGDSRPTGGSGTKTVTTETVTVAAGTFAVTRIAVTKPTNPATFIDSWVSDKVGLVKQSKRYGSADASPMTYVELRSVN